MVKDKLKNLKYLIPGILSFFFVIGLFITLKNTQQGLESNEYRFWGIFSLTMMVFMFLSLKLLDLVEKRKKSPQKERITRRIRDVKVKNIDVYKLPRIGYKMGFILFIIILYIYFLAPIEVQEYLFSLDSPIFIFLMVLVVFVLSIIIIGFLFGAQKFRRKKEPTERFLLENGEVKELLSKGSGTETDPAIIEPSEDIPKYLLFLKDSNLYVIIQNCYLERLVLDSCKNVRIENCNIWSFAIQHCSKVFVNKSTMRRFLKLWWSNNVKIEDCDINRVKFTQSNSNNIKNCTIKKIKYVYGKDNIFEANIIPDQNLSKIKKKSWFKKGNLKIK